MKENPMILKVLRLLVYSALLLASVAQAQLVNGNFATGDFTGWGISNTVGPVTYFGLSTGGTAIEQVVPFDITGTGTPVNSAEFEVGQATGIIGGGSPLEGITLYQFVPLNAGEITLSVDVAAYAAFNSASVGDFQLMLDGNDVASFSAGAASLDEVIRSTLSYSGTVTGGMHNVGISVLNGYGFGRDDSPYQFLSDFQLTNTPEPSVSVLLLAGAAVPFFVRRVRR